MSVPNAARKGDPISHTWAGVGADIGMSVFGGIGVAVGVFIGLSGDVPDAITVGIGIAALGKSLGELIGGQFTSDECGKIAEGSKTVFIGQGMPPAARMEDAVECADPGGMAGALAMRTLLPVLTGPVGGLIVAGRYLNEAYMQYQTGKPVMPGSHGGAFVADGSITCFIELKPAARVGDGTSCAGKIGKGCETVGIGGPRGMRKGTEDRSEVADSTTLLDKGLGIAGFVIGFFGPGGLTIKVGGELVLQSVKGSLFLAEKAGMPYAGKIAALVDVGEYFAKGFYGGEWRRIDRFTSLGKEFGVGSLLPAPDPKPPYVYDPKTRAISPTPP